MHALIFRFIEQFADPTLIIPDMQGIALAQIHELIGISDASANHNDSEPTNTETHP